LLTVSPVPSSTSSLEPVYPVEQRQTSADPGDGARQNSTTPAAARSTVHVQTVPGSSPLVVVTDGAFCEARLVREVEWPRTPAGSTVVVECPNNRRSEFLFVL